LDSDSFSILDKKRELPKPPHTTTIASHLNQTTTRYKRIEYSDVCVSLAIQKAAVTLNIHKRLREEEEEEESIYH
jgi:hypothetical protein